MTTILHNSGARNHDYDHDHDHDHAHAHAPNYNNHDPRTRSHRETIPTPSFAAGTSDDAFEITPTQKMMSAMSGSLVTALLVTPLDVVRVRLQSQQVRPPVVDFSRLAATAPGPAPANLGVTACCREVFFATNTADWCTMIPRTTSGVAATSTTTTAREAAPAAAAAAECAVEEVRRRTINSTIDGFRKIARNEGVTSLWRGLSPTLVMTIPANIIYFTGYDWLRFNPESPFHRAGDIAAPLLAGSSARTLAAMAVNPIELFRTRLQARHGVAEVSHLKATWHDVTQMAGEYGYKSLWRGLSLTLWRDVPFSGIYWWGYEMIRAKLTDVREGGKGRNYQVQERGRARRRPQSPESHTCTFVDSFVAGASSGAFASTVTMPFDVGKTRTQVFREAPKGMVDAAAKQGGRALIAPEQRSMGHLLWHIFKTEGLAGLWRGWIPRTLKVAPACAIMISSYEVGKRVFRGVNERRAHEEGV